VNSSILACPSPACTHAFSFAAEHRHRILREWAVNGCPRTLGRLPIDSNTTGARICAREQLSRERPA